MDWRTRIAAIVLAGGSVAGCASAADPADGGLPDVSPGSTSGLPEPGPSPAAEILIERSPAVLPQHVGRPRSRIPICNANPDPCCRSPDAPECESRRPTVGPAQRYPE